MTIIFFDRVLERYYRVENASQMQSLLSAVDGRQCRVWRIFFNDGDMKELKQKDFMIERIEADL